MDPGKLRVFHRLWLGDANPKTGSVTDRIVMRRICLVWLGVACVAAVVWVGLLLRDVVPPVDAWILDHLYAAPESTAATIATAISGMGTLLCLLALVLVAATVLRRRRARAAGFVLRSLLLGVLCSSALFLQEVILRPGPAQQPEAATYPSGHTAVITAVAFTVFILSGRLGPRWRLAALWGGATAVVLVSASRVVLAEHWLIDVAAAILAAVGVGLAAAGLLRLVPARPVPSAARHQA